MRHIAIILFCAFFTFVYSKSIAWCLPYWFLLIYSYTNIGIFTPFDPTDFFSAKISELPFNFRLKSLYFFN